MKEKSTKRQEARLAKLVAARETARADIAEISAKIKADTNRKIVKVVRDAVKNDDQNIIDILRETLENEAENLAAVKLLKARIFKKPKAKKIAKSSNL